MGHLLGHDPIPRYFPIFGEALAKIVEPLLTLRGLRRLSLMMEKIDLDHSSSDFLDMAQAWPHLEEFYVQLHEEKVSRADISSIVHFAEHCPRLRRLSMPALDVSLDGLARVTDHAPSSEPHALPYFSLPRVMFRGREGLTSPIRNAVRNIFPKAYIDLGM